MKTNSRIKKSQGRLNKKIMVYIVFQCVLSFCLVNNAFASVNRQFDRTKDILIAQFDNKPDADDIHSQAALASILAHQDNQGINFFAVTGAYGKQTGSYINSRTLFSMAFGAENIKWTDAHLDRTNSVNRILAKVKPILESGGWVWVQEAGQSDITADWIAALLAANVPAATVKSNVIVVQHSKWNEDNTTATDLTYVKSKANYIPIDDGNVDFGVYSTDRPKREIQTPSYLSSLTTYMVEAMNTNNPNVKARNFWTEANRIIKASGFNASYSVIPKGGVDFSDCVENWFIFGLADNANNVRKFWDRYVVNSSASFTVTTEAINGSVSLSPTGGTYQSGTSITATATAASDFKFDNWTENGTIVSVTNPYTFVITANRQLIANFSSIINPQYTITATAGANGSITPSGSIVVNSGASQRFDIAANPGYEVAAVTVNGVNQGAISSYTFNNVTANQTISATFKIIPVQTVTALTGWKSGNTNTKVAGSNRMMVVMVMGESSVSSTVTKVTYGSQVMTKSSEKLYFEGTGVRTYASIFTLKESGVNAASSGTISVTWSSAPSSGNSIYSVLLGNVDQTTSIGATANNGLTGTSISTTALEASSGDMVILCGATANNITQTFNNGFTKRFESNSGWGDGVGGEKMGTGAIETPKFTQSANGRMVICAIVAKKSAVVMKAPSFATDLNSNSSYKTIRIYPNPVASVLNFDFPTSEVNREIRVFNAVGQMLHSIQTKNSTAQINVKALHLKGVVMVQVNDGITVTNHKIMVK